MTSGTHSQSRLRTKRIYVLTLHRIIAPNPGARPVSEWTPGYITLAFPIHSPASVTLYAKMVGQHVTIVSRGSRLILSSEIEHTTLQRPLSDRMKMRPNSPLMTSGPCWTTAIRSSTIGWFGMVQTFAATVHTSWCNVRNCRTWSRRRAHHTSSSHSVLPISSCTVFIATCQQRPTYQMPSTLIMSEPNGVREGLRSTGNRTWPRRTLNGA